MISVSENKQKGAVSLFVVIFAMLLITIATVSFLRIMVVDQRQATDNDLSQSAYDSVTAGVEDAKRALLRFQKYCVNKTDGCGEAREAIASDYCNAGMNFSSTNVKKAAAPSPEVQVRTTTSSGDAELQQAYTCVKMTLETLDYVGSANAGSSKLVPLVGTGAFDSVTVRWFNNKDSATVTKTPGASGLPNTIGDTADKSQWKSTMPPVLRAQLIQTSTNGFKLTDFDYTKGDQSNTNSIFMYPKVNEGGIDDVYLKGAGANPGRDFRATSPDGDPAASIGPVDAKCQSDISAGQYACETTIHLPEPINGGARGIAYLRLTPFYNATHFQVLLSKNGTVKFKDVQPIVDSTGRANDVFRRALSRVDLYDVNFPYPDAAVNVSAGGFCKEFRVTDKAYIAGDSGCKP